jgi:hypothetical protein
MRGLVVIALKTFGPNGRAISRLIVIGLALALATASARADDKALIAKVKATWRAQDGETAEQIIGKASKVAHFIPRGWEVGKTKSVRANPQTHR